MTDIRYTPYKYLMALTQIENFEESEKFIIRSRACIGNVNVPLLSDSECVMYSIAKGSTPLILAARYGRLTAVNMILGAGAGTGLVEECKKTALMYACQFCYPEIVKVLLYDNCSTDKISSSGKTARDYIHQVSRMHDTTDTRTSDEWNKDKSKLIDVWNAYARDNGKEIIVSGAAAGGAAAGGAAAGGAAAGGAAAGGAAGGIPDVKKLAKDIVGGIFAAHMMERGHAIRYTPKKP